jgi:hypothetical protein
VDEKAVMAGLQEILESVGVEVRCERMKGDVAFFPGGLCRLKGRPVVIINNRASQLERLMILARAVKGFDLSHIYLKPAVREFLERI